MADWREIILKHFKKDIARLTLVSDPDGLLTEEKMLTEIKNRGFDLIPYDDPIAFRFAYESKYRSMWDQGEATDLVVVLRSEHDLHSLPYDLFHAGRRLEFRLHKLFPTLNYPVLSAIDTSLLDPLFEAYQQDRDSRLGGKATKEFVLRWCFRIECSMIRDPVDFLRAILPIFAADRTIPNILAEHLADSLCDHANFTGWPIRKLLSAPSVFFAFLQQQWELQIAALVSQSGDDAPQVQEPRDRFIRASEVDGIIIPFEHQDIRAYIDTFFLEGRLSTVKCGTASSLPSWARVGVQFDPREDELKRIAKLLQHCRSCLPSAEDNHRNWQHFARTWAEAITLRWQLDSSLGVDIRDQWRELHDVVEQRFAAWMQNRFASLHNLPFVPQPVMVHHVARYLASFRADHGLKKLALVVMDGLSLDQWLVLRGCLEEKRQQWRLEESTVFAWVPSLTSISRQSIFAAEPPLYFPDSLETTDREPKHWTRFWEDHDVNAGSVGYAKMVKSGTSEVLEPCLGNPHVSVVGLVVNTVDKIMHGEQQGTAGMHDAIRLWADDAISLIDRLFQDGFEVFMTADHGNIAAEGIGLPREGVLVEVAGKRARIYDNANFRAEAAKEYPNTIEWPSIGLPQDRHVLLPKGLGAFTPENKHVVSHGGISLEEIIVPFVHFVRDE